MPRLEPLSSDVPAPAIDLMEAVAQISRYVEMSGGNVVAICVRSANGLVTAGRPAADLPATDIGANPTRIPPTEHQP